jgi:uncharacterized membrane protein
VSVHGLLEVVQLLGSGITAGVLVCVTISLVPTFLALPADRYLEVHRLAGRGFDPAMPVIVLGTTAVTAALACQDSSRTVHWLRAAAVLLLLGVSAVSHLCNVPINRRIRQADPAAVLADWPDPRQTWRRWNLLRTAFAVLALLINSLAMSGS